MSFRKLQSISKYFFLSALFSERGFFFWKKLSRHLLCYSASVAGKSIIVAVRFDNVLPISLFRFSTVSSFILSMNGIVSHMQTLSASLQITFLFLCSTANSPQISQVSFQVKLIGLVNQTKNWDFRCIRRCLFLSLQPLIVWNDTSFPSLTFPSRYMHQEKFSICKINVFTILLLRLASTMLVLAFTSTSTTSPGPLFT